MISIMCEVSVVDDRVESSECRDVHDQHRKIPVEGEPVWDRVDTRHASHAPT